MLNRNAARPTAFQFTHPRRVRRKSILHLGSASLLVSIHAPTRGVTRTGQLEHLGIGVSIHAPTRGATAKWRRHCGLSRFQFTHPRGVRRCKHAGRRKDRSGFNSRTREGCDHTVKSKSGSNTVSIHAPARGATLSQSIIKRDLLVSIHAPARGATRRNNLKATAYPVSIHAPARGATFISINNQARLACFNSRTREGCDAFYQSRGHRRRVSIHAPARGAT